MEPRSTYEFDDELDDLDRLDGEAREDRNGSREPQISRFDTALRLLLTLLFFVVWNVTETVLFALTVFGVIFSLVTREAPPPGVRAFSNRLATYAYRVWRYLTQNDPQVPFPFSEWPEPLEPSRDLRGDSARELREMLSGAVEDLEEDARRFESRHRRGRRE